MTDTATLRRELREAFEARAHLYRLTLTELTPTLGRAGAEAALTAIVRRRGEEVAALLFKDTPPTPQAIARRFLEFSPDGGALYPHDVVEADGAVTISVHSCPLKSAWGAAGLDGGQVGALCRVAGEFDRALFEAAGVAFENSTWSPERGDTGCCRITLRAR